MGAFMLVILKMKAKEAYEAFREYHPSLKPFRDASKGDCFYECTVLHCLLGLEEALKLGWYEYEKFDAREYEHYEKVENGDLNWIVPGKFIAFMGPVDRD
jgi:cell division cycle 14